MVKSKSTKCALPAPTTCAIYRRVSTDEQATNGYGLDVQLAKCEAMALVKGWTVVNVYSDDGISGTKGATDRPGLATMLQAAAAGLFDAVIISALDRLGRKTTLVLDLVDMLDDYGVSLVSTKESLDTTTPTGVFVLSMFAALAQLERDVIIERTTGGRNARGLIDGEKGGRVPMGYTRTADGIVIDDEAAAIVRTVFELRSGMTLAQVADALNARGIRTARGKGWHASSVREILLNEANYRGGPRNDSPINWPVILGG